MSRYPKFDVQLEHGERLVASAEGYSFGGRWLSIDISPEVCGGGMRLFIPGKDDARAERIANAINAAWDGPAQRPVSPGLRAEDVLPIAPLDALQGGGTDGEAA